MACPLATLRRVKDEARLPQSVTRSKWVTIPAPVYHQVCAVLAEQEAA